MDEFVSNLWDERFAWSDLIYDIEDLIMEIFYLFLDFPDIWAEEVD